MKTPIKLSTMKAIIKLISGLKARGLITLFAAAILLLSLDLMPATADEGVSLKTEQGIFTPIISHSSFTDELLIGLKGKMEEHWHTYWQNPGDSGLPMKVIFDDPGLTGDILWPPPKLFKIAHLVNFGYEGKFVLPVKINISNLDGEFDISGRFKILVCKEECIPYEVPFAFNVSRSPKATPTKSYGELLKAQNSIVKSDIGLPSEISEHSLRIDLPDDIESAFFYPIERIFDYSEGNWFQKKGSLSYKFDSYAEIPEVIAGIVELDGEYYNIRFSRDVSPSEISNGIEAERNRTNQLRTSDPKINSPAAFARGQSYQSDDAQRLDSAPYTLLTLLSFGFIGGIILNLMPCVFPVVFLKLYSVIGGVSKKSSLLYTVGVLGSLAALYLVLVILKHLGSQIGWGFQLQNRYFVAAMTIFVFFWALTLLDVIVFGSNIQNLAGRAKVQKNGLGEVLSGFLTVFIASPCTAPLMGVAIGAALQANVVQGLTIFLSIGLGLSSPFLLLSLLPGLHKFLPKPGNWMVYLKKLLALPMFGAVVWLMSIYHQQAGSFAMFILLYSLVAISFGALIYGFNQFKNSASSRALRAAAIAIIVATAGYNFMVVPVKASESTKDTSSIYEQFSKSRLKEDIADGQVVFVDFTATWCITCQVNKFTTLETDRFKAFLLENKITPLRADWTDYNPEITEELNNLGKSSIPTYAFYHRDLTNPVVISSIVTMTTFTDAYTKIKEQINRD